MFECCANSYTPYVKNGECRFCLKKPNVLFEYAPFVLNGYCRFCYKIHKTNKSCNY
jgi:hypothetical protein